MHGHEHHGRMPVRHTISDFVPLIAVLGAVAVATAVTAALVGETPFDTARFFIGYFFLMFGTLKVFRWHGFVEAYRTYDLIAMRSRIYAYLYPLIEIGLAAAFLAGVFLFWASVVVVVVMTIGALGVYRTLRKREVVPCACLGTVFKLPMTYVTLGEDVLMAGMAIGMLTSGMV